MELRKAQLRQRRKRYLPARVWNNDQLKNSNVQELDTMVFVLAGCALWTEIPLLAYDLMERLRAIRRPAEDV
jgi:hypothetical protein